MQSPPLATALDDESYFTLDGAGMPGNSGYYTTDKNETLCDVKHRTESKFPEKVMIWNVISEVVDSFMFPLKGSQ